MKLYLRRILLSVLAVLPIAPIAIAAESKLLEMEGQATGTVSPSADPLLLKSQLFPPYALSTDYDSALARFSQQTGITDLTILNADFRSTLQQLQAQGLLEINDKELRSAVPSDHGL